MPGRQSAMIASPAGPTIRPRTVIHSGRQPDAAGPHGTAPCRRLRWSGAVRPGWECWIRTNRLSPTVSSPSDHSCFSEASSLVTRLMAPSTPHRPPERAINVPDRRLEPSLAVRIQHGGDLIVPTLNSTRVVARRHACPRVTETLDGLHHAGAGATHVAHEARKSCGVTPSKRAAITAGRRPIAAMSCNARACPFGRQTEVRPGVPRRPRPNA